MTGNRQLSDHFTLGELTRSETAERRGIDNSAPPDLVPKLERLCAKILEPVREHFGRPFRPNSGYRCSELNNAIGGSARSQHCQGEAVDIEIPGISNMDLALWIRDTLEFDQLILECYRPGEPISGWVHISLKEEGEVNRSDVLTYSNQQYSVGLVA